MKKSLLRAENLCKSFASNGIQNHILDNVNLDIYEGDFTVIMGASGSGKSTLLYCLSGMDGITTGKVFYGDKTLNELKEKQMADIRVHEFGFIFQQMQLVSNLSMWENVVIPGYLDKEKSANQVETRAEELLKSVNVFEAKDRLPAQVSGGEAQRCAIARAMINEPRILFADEPTGALNRKNTEDVLKLLTKFNEQGQSILMVTHDIKAALRATRLLYLEDGNICGQITLPPFSEDKARDREVQINAWLTSLEW